MPKIDIFVFFKALENPKSCEVYQTENSLFVLKLQLLEIGMVLRPQNQQCPADTAVPSACLRSSIDVLMD